MPSSPWAPRPRRSSWWGCRPCCSARWAARGWAPGADGTGGTSIRSRSGFSIILKFSAHVVVHSGPILSPSSSSSSSAAAVTLHRHLRCGQVLVHGFTKPCMSQLTRAHTPWSHRRRRKWRRSRRYRAGAQPAAQGAGGPGAGKCGPAFRSDQMRMRSEGYDRRWF